MNEFILKYFIERISFFTHMNRYIFKCIIDKSVMLYKFLYVFFEKKGTIKS